MKINSKIISIVTLALLLNACSGGNSAETENNTAANASSGRPVIEGKLIDAPVAGATYMCGEITQMTGSDGSFICDTYPVRFYAGGVKLGEIHTLAQDGYVTPQDLLGLDRDNYEDQVAHLALFLQSLDDDGDIESVITLDEELIKKLKDKQLDIKNMSDTQLIELLDGIGAANSVSREDALRHLRTHIAQVTSAPIPASAPQSTPSTETPEQTSTDQTPADTTTGTGSGTTNGTSTDTPTQETSTSNVPKLDDAVKQAYLDAINDARSESHTCGEYGVKQAVPALQWNDALYKASWQHSNDMAQTNTFSHTGSGKDTDITAQSKHPGKGSTPGERIVHNGYANWRAYGENIAAGTVMDEAQEAIDGWLKSPGHCVNLMSPNFKEVGMAHVLKSDSHYTHYWTQDFGSK